MNKYFVSYCYSKDGFVGNGHIIMRYIGPISEKLIDVGLSLIKKENQCESVVILNIIKLEEEEN